MNNGTWVEAHHKIEGALAVIFSAVTLILLKEGTIMVKEAAAEDFVADAFAHMKFIAYSEEAKPLLN